MQIKINCDLLCHAMLRYALKSTLQLKCLSAMYDLLSRSDQRKCSFRNQSKLQPLGMCISALLLSAYALQLQNPSPRPYMRQFPCISKQSCYECQINIQRDASAAAGVRLFSFATFVSGRLFEFPIVNGRLSFSGK